MRVSPPDLPGAPTSEKPDRSGPLSPAAMADEVGGGAALDCGRRRAGSVQPKEGGHHVPPSQAAGADRGRDRGDSRFAVRIAIDAGNLPLAIAAIGRSAGRSGRRRRAPRRTWRTPSVASLSPAAGGRPCRHRRCPTSEGLPAPSARSSRVRRSRRRRRKSSTTLPPATPRPRAAEHAAGPPPSPSSAPRAEGRRCSGPRRRVRDDHRARGSYRHQRRRRGRRGSTVSARAASLEVSRHGVICDDDEAAPPHRARARLSSGALFGEDGAAVAGATRRERRGPHAAVAILLYPPSATGSKRSRVTPPHREHRAGCPLPSPPHGREPRAHLAGPGLGAPPQKSGPCWSSASRPASSRKGDKIVTVGEESRRGLHLVASGQVAVVVLEGVMAARAWSHSHPRSRATRWARSPWCCARMRPTPT